MNTLLLLGVVAIACILAGWVCLLLARGAAEPSVIEGEVHDAGWREARRAAAVEIAALASPRQMVLYDPRTDRWTNPRTGHQCSTADLYALKLRVPNTRIPTPEHVSAPKSARQDAPGTTIVDALDLGYPLK